MKNQMKVLIAIVLAVFMVNSVSAQGRHGKGMRGDKVCEMIPDLTDQQKEKIKTLRTEQMKTALAAKNQMGELHARLRTLETANKVDQSAINNTIDQLGKVRTEMQKRRAEHRQQVRKLLTEEQRLVFDSRAGKRGKGKMRKGRRHGCQGNDCSRGNGRRGNGRG